MSRQGTNDVYLVEPADGFGDARAINRRELRLCNEPEWIPSHIPPPRNPHQQRNSNPRARRISDSTSDSDDVIVTFRRHNHSDRRGSYSDHDRDNSQSGLYNQNEPNVNNREYESDSHDSEDIGENNGGNSNTESESESVNTVEPVVAHQRKSTRATAGYHRNIHKLPRSVYS